MIQQHRTLPIIEAMLVRAKYTVLNIGRGGAKTTTGTSDFAYYFATEMPRSTGFLLSVSYTHLETQVVPGIVEGWMSYGLIENEHFWVYKKPPAHLKIPQPYRKVDKPEHYIFLCNGSVIKLTSNSKQSPINSGSYDWGLVEEAKLQDGHYVRTTAFPTLRGGRTNLIDNEYIIEDGRKRPKMFADCPNHHGFLIVSDLGENFTQNWFLEYKEQHNQNAVNAILAMQYEIQQLKLKLDNAARNIPKIQNRIEHLQNMIDFLRKRIVHFVSASSLANIHALGIDVFKGWRKTMKDREYKLSVLNIDDQPVENCFYGKLSKQKHGYHALNTNYLKTLTQKTERDCRWDADVVINYPLEIAMDYNLSISCMLVSQKIGNNRLILKDFHSLAPKTHRHLVDKICKYYAPMQNKKVVFTYNHTLTNGEIHGQDSKAMEVIEQFQKNGWVVVKNYIGAAWSHQTIYESMNNCFDGNSNTKYLFNIDNCKDFYVACMKAPATVVLSQKKTKFVKDKRSEQRKGPKNIATHMTEPFDQWVQSDAMNNNTNNFAFMG